MPWLMPWIIHSIACRHWLRSRSQFARHGGSNDASTDSMSHRRARPRARSATHQGAEQCVNVDYEPPARAAARAQLEARVGGGARRLPWARHALGDLRRVEHELVHLALLSRKAPARREGPRDVRGIALVLRAGI